MSKSKLTNKTCSVCRRVISDGEDCICSLLPFSLNDIPPVLLGGLLRVMESPCKEFYKDPINIKNFKKWEIEYKRRKRLGIKPAIPPTNFGKLSE